MTQIQKDMIKATLVGIEAVSIPTEVVTGYFKTSEVSIDGENPVKVHEFEFDGTEDFYGAEWYTPAYTDAWGTDPACMRLYVVASDGTRLDFFKDGNFKPMLQTLVRGGKNDYFDASHYDAGDISFRQAIYEL